MLALNQGWGEVDKYESHPLTTLHPGDGICYIFLQILKIIFYTHIILLKKSHYAVYTH